MARVHLYMAFQRWDRALPLWEETMARYPDLEQGPVIYATLLQHTGKSAAAETLLRRLLDERGDDPALLTQVGDLGQL